MVSKAKPKASKAARGAVSKAKQKDDKKKYKSVSLRIETHDRCASYMKFGDTFDGFINKLLDLSQKAL